MAKKVVAKQVLRAQEQAKKDFAALKAGAKARMQERKKVRRVKMRPYAARTGEFWSGYLMASLVGGCSVVEAVNNAWVFGRGVGLHPMTREDAVFYAALRNFLGVGPVANDGRCEGQSSQPMQNDVGARWLLGQASNDGFHAMSGQTYRHRGAD